MIQTKYKDLALWKSKQVHLIPSPDCLCVFSLHEIYTSKLQTDLKNIYIGLFMICWQMSWIHSSLYHGNTTPFKYSWIISSKNHFLKMHFVLHIFLFITAWIDRYIPTQRLLLLMIVTTWWISSPTVKLLMLPILGVYLCSAMGIALVNWPTGPGFKFCRDFHFSE